MNSLSVSLMMFELNFFSPHKEIHPQQLSPVSEGKLSESFPELLVCHVKDTAGKAEEGGAYSTTGS